MRQRLMFAAFVVAMAVDRSAGAQVPAAVEPILTKAAIAVGKNRIAFDKSNVKPLSEAQKGLADLAENLNKAKQVAQATAVQNLMNGLEAEVMKRARIQYLAPPSVLEKLVGTWTHPKMHLNYTFSKDGTLSETLKADGTLNSTGPFREVKPGVVQADLKNGYRLEITLAGDDRIAVFVWDPKGDPEFFGMVLDRLP